MNKKCRFVRVQFTTYVELTEETDSLGGTADAMHVLGQLEQQAMEVIKGSAACDGTRLQLGLTKTIRRENRGKKC